MSSAAVKEASTASSPQQSPSTQDAMDFEAHLMTKDKITPEDVLLLTKVTDQYLCKPEANVYGLDFTRFKIRDLESDSTLFEIAKDPNMPVVVRREMNICNNRFVHTLENCFRYCRDH